MRQFLTLCFMVLLVSGCESIDVRRFLNERYCPEALVLQGAQRLNGKVQATLARLEVACNLSWSGDIAKENIKIDSLRLEINIPVLLEKPQKASLALFIVLLNQRDLRIVRRQRFSLNAEQGKWLAPKKVLELDADIANKGSEYIALVGFVVSDSQMNKNLGLGKKLLKSRLRSSLQ